MEGNLATNLYRLLKENSSYNNIEAVQWKLLGQEKDGSLLLSWIENTCLENKEHSYSVIGCYVRECQELRVLHKFSKIYNIIQATVNQNHSVLGFVTKLSSSDLENLIKNEEETMNDVNSKLKNDYYQANIVQLTSYNRTIHKLVNCKSNQVKIQFLYKDKTSQVLDKLLVLVHKEYIHMHTILYYLNQDAFRKTIKEIIVNDFIWAQWDPTNQVLYHIHNKKPLTSVFTEDVAKELHKPPCSTSTLSALQFHDNLPHETVLNVPLNLPQFPNSDNCGTYEDDVIPLRIHDCSLDLIVISAFNGIICICHHYLYRPVQPPQHLLDSELSNSNTVHFAYSVTLLHHSCVIHCVIPGIPWTQAKLMRPTFAIHSMSYMVVFVQNCFTHLLEIGFDHQPCCHILCGPLPNVPSQSTYLVPLLNLNNQNGSLSSVHAYFVNSNNTEILTIDLPTLDLVTLKIPTSFLIDTFKKETSVEVRCSILHFFLCHGKDLLIVADLISTIANKPCSLDSVKVMQEFLFSYLFIQLRKRRLYSDELELVLPVSTMEEHSTYEVKVNYFNITLRQEKLWNTLVMLLSRQQRLVPYRDDLWAELWSFLNKKRNVTYAAEKQSAFSLELMSCNKSFVGLSNYIISEFRDLEEFGNNYRCILPFYRKEKCTDSKLNDFVYTSCYELAQRIHNFGFKKLTIHRSLNVFLTLQFEASDLLCKMLCKAANFDGELDQERGFPFVDKLEDSKRLLLFTILERYKYATENIRFPVVEGFASFFTYLGYRTLKFSTFLQYVQNSVFELQDDVAKVIMEDIGDKKPLVSRKLDLLSLVSRTKSKHLLNLWVHPISFMLRAREHAANILSGKLCESRNKFQNRHLKKSLSAFFSTDRLSPLDTFLNLLTAKASLTELDFELLIEATVISTEDAFSDMKE